jgi:hypothetical protein
VDGELVATEERSLSIDLYFKSEVVLMLEGLGFEDIRVTGGISDRDGQPYQDEPVMFAARAADGSTSVSTQTTAHVVGFHSTATAPPAGTLRGGVARGGVAGPSSVVPTPVSAFGRSPHGAVRRRE